MIHVAVESTPNENSLKFLPKDTQVLESEQGTGIVRVCGTSRFALTFHGSYRSNTQTSLVLQDRR